jgi:hypothetical protein
LLDRIEVKTQAPAVRDAQPVSEGRLEAVTGNRATVEQRSGSVHVKRDRDYSGSRLIEQPPLSFAGSTPTGD